MSEQTSPLHQPATTVPARPASRLQPSVRLGAGARDWALTATLIALAGLLLIGAYLRFSDQNWDQSGPGTPSGHQHPDERFLTGISTGLDYPSSPLEYFDTDSSPLNPYNIQLDGGGTQGTFVYGTLPLFLNKVLADNLSVLTLGMVDDYDDYDHYNLAGRSLSALFDIGTIVFIFLLGCRLANRATGLVAAFLYTFSAFAIQNAHFFIVDPYMTFFVAATLYFAVRAAQIGGYWNLATAGVMAGLGMACKTTAIALLPVVVLAAGIYAWPAIQPFVAPLWSGDRRAGAAERNGVQLDRTLITFAAGSLVALAGAFVAYRIAMPYAFNAPDIAQWFQYRTGHIGPFPFPYPDIMNQHWIADQSNQRDLLDGSAFPPNVQWIGRSAWAWPAQQMVSWGMGPAFGIVAWIGLVFTAIWAIWKRDWAWLVPLAWTIGYFGFMGMQFSLYMRYFLPLYPAMAVFAAFLLVKTVEWGASGEPFAFLGRRAAQAERLRPAVRYGTQIAVALVLTLTAAWGLAFFNMYDGWHSRVQASQWIHENIPAGAVLGHEHWDDVVPFAVGGVPVQSYEHVEFQNYNRDDDEKVAELINNLDRVDYIVLASGRLSLTIPRVPAAWPVTARYYEALESGDLGFRKVREFTSYPEIFGIEFDDTGAEESFSVYDHPKVTVYEKTEEFDLNHAIEVIGADAFMPGVTTEPRDLHQNAMLYQLDVAARVKTLGDWGDIFDASSLVNDHPLIFWLLAIELAAFAIFPVTGIMFRALPDRGFLLTKPLGVLLLSWLVYVPASYGVVDFTRPVIATALVAMVAAGLIGIWRWSDELGAFVRERWRFLLLSQAVFLLIFAFGYWLRMQNPDLWHPGQGGEKPMDMAYFTATTRSEDLTQGAVDPWHAGGYLNYYYYGQFIAATVTKLLGVVPEIAYNLVVPMFFAFSAAAIFSVSYNLAESTRRVMRRRTSGAAIGARGPIICAMLAVFLVLLAGNLKAVDVLATNLQNVSAWDSNLPVVGPLITMLGGFWEIIVGDTTLRQVAYSYDWWDPSRALDVNDPAREVSPITEFPFWTFLFADLHAHLMAIPFSLTAVGVALAFVLNVTRLNPLPQDAGGTKSREVTGWAMVVLLAVVVGSLRWINSWDYPPFLLLAAAAIVIAELAKERGRLHVRLLLVAGAKVAVMGVLSYLFYAQFAKNYHAPYGDTSTPIIESVQTTALEDYFSHWTILLLPIAAFAIFMLHRALTRDTTLRVAFAGTDRKSHSLYAWLAIAVSAAVLGAVIAAATDSHPAVLVIIGALALVTLGIISVELSDASRASAGAVALYAVLALGFGALLIVLWDFTPDSWAITSEGATYPEATAVIGLSAVAIFVMALLGARELRNMTPMAPIRLFLYCMIGLGFALTLCVEVWTFNTDIGRMNTVFKFYLHVWLLWGIAAAYAVWYLFAVLQPQRALAKASMPSLGRAPRYALAGLIGALLLLALVYPYFGTRARIHNRFDPAQGASINGMEYMETAVYRENVERRGVEAEHELRYDRDAIYWMREHVDGMPAIIEAVTPLYRWGGRYSVYTGLPTVIGWDWHQTQQRQGFQELVAMRQQDVNAFYDADDVDFARSILKKYDVEYVVVGSVERAYYDPAGIEKFNDGLGGVLELVYSNPGVQIWHVIPQEELQQASAQ